MEQFSLILAFSIEEDTFLKNTVPITKAFVPVKGKIVGSHTVYKIITNDDETLK